MTTRPSLRKSAATAWPYNLGSLAVFSECSPTELERLGSLLTMLRVPAGTTLMNEGTIGLEFVVIVDGTAAVRVADAIVARLGAGDFVGEMSLLRRERRSATVDAETELT